jgi:L-seryl-tRNA(Ser) seleniumtransferase
MNPYRQLPSVDRLLELCTANGDYNHHQLVNACRHILEKARDKIQQGDAPPTETTLINRIHQYLHAAKRLSLQPIINATGVIIHTNLGRAPLSRESLEAIHDVAIGFSNLEYDLDAGGRGKRDVHVETLLTALTGAEAAMVVNNNAAAVYLVLSGLALGREVVISRGELVEIGGGFRIPDVMRQSGVALVEVGTTNRTRLKDFEHVITEQTAALMRVHSSNFRVIGFTESVKLSDLTNLAHQHNLIVIDDLGSGTFLDTSKFGLEREPTIQESIAGGADIVTFSGDKLLGGPQAGLIVGRKTLIEQLKRHPLARALRPDKLCVAGLSMTLKHYQDELALEKIPVWQMISMPLDVIEKRAQAWQRVLGGTVIKGESTVGGGSLPGNSLPTWVLALAIHNADDFAATLRHAETPIIGRIQDDRFLLDPRTVLPDQDDTLVEILQLNIKGITD